MTISINKDVGLFGLIASIVSSESAEKTSEIRFYTLRIFFRKQPHQMGFEKVNYMMGHTVRGSDTNYQPQDPEFYRQLYEEKAMPFLRLETATPTETEKTIDELKKQLTERDKEIKAMKETMAKIERLVQFVNSFNSPEELKTILGYLKDEFTYSKDGRFRSIRAEFSPYIKDKLDRNAKSTYQVKY